MALVKFYRGGKSKYSESVHVDGIYFALDTQEIIVNGKAYGYYAKNHREISTVEYTEPDTVTITYTNGESDTVLLQTAEAGDSIESSKAGLIGASDIYKLSKIEESAEVNIINTIKVDNIALTPNADREVNIDLTGIKADIKKNKVTSADNSTAVVESADGTTIKVKLKSDGAINLTDDGLEVDATARVEYKGDSKAITVSETDSNNERTIGLKLNSKSGNLLVASADGLYSSVKLKKLTVGSDSPNVASSYGLVGLQPDGTEIVISDVTIDIMKDKFLNSVELGTIPAGLTGAGNDALVFVFNLADGSTTTKYVDVSSFLREAEAGDGITFTTGSDGVKRYTVKIDTASSEKSSGVHYLQVDSSGLKIVGLNAALAKATTEVKSKADGHVVVTVTTAADGHAVATVTENDIASASTLSALTDQVNSLEADWEEVD